MYISSTNLKAIFLLYLIHIIYKKKSPKTIRSLQYIVMLTINLTTIFCNFNQNLSTIRIYRYVMPSWREHWKSYYLYYRLLNGNKYKVQVQENKQTYIIHWKLTQQKLHEGTYKSFVKIHSFLVISELLILIESG